MLKIQFKDKRREPVWVVEKAFSIGRAPDNSLVLSEDSVSSYHARILVEDGQFVLQDCGSDQGTFVNGRRINQRQIGCNDTIRLGRVEDGVELDIVDPLQDETGDSAPYWALIANASWLAGQEFPLAPDGGDTVLIGRGSHCDVVFPGTHLSREHARIAIGKDQVTITDLVSANGTYLNDEKVKGTVTAKAGDRLRLDIYSFTLLGPGMKLPQSVVQPLPDAGKDAENGGDQDAPKRWKTRPTSPGNREEPVVNTSSPTIIWLSLLLLLILIAATVYVLLD